jgi:sigma-B regulation protein RsbU (phosphoserine phosphatase)
MNRISSRRFGVVLRRLSPLDRIALAIVILYVVFRVARAFGRAIPFTSFLGFLAFVAVLYFVVRLMPWVRTKLLWRLRSRLVVAYVFIAVVPVILLLSMVGLGAYSLYLQLGAHLLQDDLQERVSTVSAEGDAIAGAIQQEIAHGAPATEEGVMSHPAVTSLITAARELTPNLRVELNRGEELLRLGGGSHFAGLVERQGTLWIDSAVTRTTANGRLVVLAGVPVTPELLDNLASDLGPIQLTVFRSVETRPTTGILLEVNGHIYVPREHIASRRRVLRPAANWFDVRVNGYSTLEAVPLQSGDDATPIPVVSSFFVRPMSLNRVLFASVGELASALLLALTLAGFVFLILEAAALVTGVVLTRTITRAIDDLYEATLHVRRGDFSYRVRVHKRDQIGALGDSFNEMTSSVSELIAEQRQRQKLENEITIAREVQEQLFPHSLPSMAGLQVGATCRPARTVSGDYYDFISLGPTRMGIAIADISGKGIFAALLMASLQAALRSMASLNGHGGTATLVTRLNSHLFKNTSDDRYATFFYAVYDTESRMLTYTNAGHLAPFFVNDAGVQQLDTGGTVVGLFEDPPYTQGSLKVAPGSVLVAFSDGLTEAENVYGEEFGMQRLKEEVMRQRNASPQRLAENLIAATEQWAGTPEQADDITVVVAKMG